ncbi:NAD(P)H-hydrate dehydratase [Virgibacillus alimentarius]|uniref:Bifunctional NAD(P)H-hydrate repair enzyme n=1 Tax=Virgibacillus alimentarius TaxID=698769 RepID=A0ABS4S9X7_9BACI|nr:MULTISPECIES: NAD(P)H-hydrate dehydratase [Virgibacillus]MBP2258308.1 NAD(P)H-hydrate epimerase [Virgibacillus alimentarius]HLR67315.1 NAD(P)H-hydrate dehydratase [Virgibacillus sp.]
MYIVTAKEMYDIDHYTIEKVGIDGKLLMENAGREIARKVEAKVNEATDKMIVFAGAGNNGGDGFVIARTLLNRQYDVSIMQVVPNEKITGDAFFHKQLFVNCGGSVSLIAGEKEIANLVRNADIIVDAMVGIGVKGILREPIATIASIINKEAKAIISVDIPSGLPADEGISDFKSVQADYTIVIGAPKISLFLQHTAPFYGKWDLISIGFPLFAFQKYAHRYVVKTEHFQKTLPKRSPYSHKGSFGRGLVVGGSQEMPGSLVMAVKAALKSGAGLVTAGTIKSVIETIASECIEATYLPLSEMNGYLDNDSQILLDKYDAIAIGIGMGRMDETGILVRKIAKEANCPVVIDADGLYHIKDCLTMLEKRTPPTIVTPHPGEMAMLLNIPVPELLKAPFTYTLDFAKKYRVYVVLKGTYTIITAPNGKQAVSLAGNPGLAKGGSGDVLTGIILAMTMQDQSIFQGICNACFIHGTAADMLVEEMHSYYDLMASDVIEGISKVYRTFS